jgi:enterochelin esterase-like enzyme
VSQIDAVRRMRAAIAAKGATVLGADFEGGHDPACWKPDLVEALRALHGD